MCTQYHLLFSLPPEKYFYNEILSRKYLHLHLNFSIQKSLMTENRKWNNDRLILSVPIVTKINDTKFNYHFITFILKSQNLVSTNILLIE